MAAPSAVSAAMSTETMIFKICFLFIVVVGFGLCMLLAGRQDSCSLGQLTRKGEEERHFVFSDVGSIGSIGELVGIECYSGLC